MHSSLRPSTLIAAILLAILTIHTQQACAQRFDWVGFTPLASNNGNNGSGGLAVTSDNDNNLYTVATFFAPIYVGEELVASNGNNLLLTKWNQDGQATAHKVLSTSMGNQVTAYSLAYDDANEHILLTNNLMASVTIEGDTTYTTNTGSQIMRFDEQLNFISYKALNYTNQSPMVCKDGNTYSASNYQSLIKRLDSNNQEMWSVAPSSGTFEIGAITITPQDTIYAVGIITGGGLNSPIVSYGDYQFIAPNSGNNSHVVIVKLDTLGIVHGGRYLCEGAVSTHVRIACDAAGNLFVALQHANANQTIDDLPPLNPTMAGDVLVLKLNGALEAQWYRELQDTGGNMECRALAVHSSGKVMLAGLYAGSCTLGDFPLLSSAFGTGYLALLDHQTGEIEYATYFGSIDGTSRPYDLVVRDDTYYISGLSYSAGPASGSYGCFTETYTSQYLTAFTDAPLILPTVSLAYGNASLQAIGNAEPALYQWYYNGVLLENETGNTLVPVEDGLYTVVMTHYGCTATDQLTVDVPEVMVREVYGDSLIAMYPNPTDGICYLMPYAHASSNLIIEVLNALGQVVSSIGNFNTTTMLDLSAQAAGIHYLRVQSEGAVQVIRILKK